jgi:hypothetical protein
MAGEAISDSSKGDDSVTIVFPEKVAEQRLQMSIFLSLEYLSKVA